MKATRILVVLLAALWAALPTREAGAASGGEYTATGKAGDFDVRLTIDHNPPVIGQNIVTIAVSDSAGRPLTYAAVRLEYSLPATPGGKPVTYDSQAAPIGDAYKAPMTLATGGAWLLTVSIAKNGKTSTASFTVDIR